MRQHNNTIRADSTVTVLPTVSSPWKNRSYRLLILGLVCCGCIPTTPLVPTDAATRPASTRNTQLVAEDPKEILAQAITAMGGEKALKRLQNNLFKGRGRIIAGSAPADYRLRTQNALPDRLREDIEYLDAANHPKVTIISIINGDKGTVQYNTEQKPMDAVALKSWKDVLYTNLVMTLVPLREPRFTLVAEPPARKDGILCRSFTVKSSGHRDVTFYFDKETHLPVMVQTTILEPNQLLEMTQELYWRDFKNFEGLVYPTRWVVYLNGNKMQEFVIEEAHFPEKVDEQAFQQP